MTLQRAYMVGIGGIGMSALAQLLTHRGWNVRGVDRDESPTTRLLRDKGIEVVVGDTTLPKDVDVLIFSDAIAETNPIRIEGKQRGLRELSYFEMLGEISRGVRIVAVAGTHGKTTTTGMLTKILIDAGERPTAIIGSIVSDFGSNFVAGREDLLVVEACEYRDHLLKLSPEILVITNIELDHTDYFPSLSALQNTFRTAIERVPRRGFVVTHPEHANIAPLLKGVGADVIDYTQKAVGALKLVGEFNRENARAALAAALAVAPHISQEAAVHSLSEFKGSWRRFEFKGETKKGALVFDDYAHHPTAIKKTIAAAREKFPKKRIVVAFHPHLYSRTRDLFDGFVDALATADQILLAPIYAARETDEGDISSERLAASIQTKNSSVEAFQKFEDIRASLDNTASQDDLIITMGAGDIYKVAEQLTDE